MKEYIIWGKSTKNEHDDILHTQSKTMIEAKNIMGILKNEFKCFDMRVQVLDLENDDIVGNFVKAIQI